MILRSTYIEVDLRIFERNLKKILSVIGTKTKLMLVLKDDAYGLGALELGLFANKMGIMDFAVATLGEAIDLRRGGLRGSILLLGYLNRSSYGSLIENDISLNIWSFSQGEALNKVALGLGTKAKVHISIDTGLSRLGLLPNRESMKVIEAISKLEGIEIEGTFSHFARTETDDDDFSMSQLENFLEFTAELTKASIPTGLIHMADSAGLVKFPSSHLEMVRCGALALGSMKGRHILREDKQFAMEEVLVLECEIARVLDLPKGTSVSYDASYIADKDIRVITLPIGYGDGVCVQMEGQMEALINGTRVRQIGSMCMDMMMFDASGLDVHVGDKVTLLGKSGQDEITLDDWGIWAGYSPTFVLSLLRHRIPKIYKY